MLCFFIFSCSLELTPQPAVTKSVASTSSAETDVESLERSHHQAKNTPASSPITTQHDPTSVDKNDTSHSKEPSTDSAHELQEIHEQAQHASLDKEDSYDNYTLPDIDALPPPPDHFLIGSPEKEKPTRVINRKKRDQHSALGSSRNSSCVSTDSTISSSTSDSGIGVRTFSTSDSPRTSPTRETSEIDDYDKDHNLDEGFKSSREALDDDDEYGSIDQPETRRTPSDLDAGSASPGRADTPDSSRGSSRPNSMVLVSPKIEELDQEKVRNSVCDLQ